MSGCVVSHAVHTVGPETAEEKPAHRDLRPLINARFGGHILFQGIEVPELPLQTPAPTKLITIEDANGNLIKMDSSGITIESQSSLTLKGVDVTIEASAQLTGKGNPIHLNP